MKRRLFLALTVAAAAFPAAGQDYLREQRWKAEVLSNLVVGDAVRIGPSGGSFLGLYTQGRPGRPVVLLLHGAGVHPDHGVIGILEGPSLQEVQAQMARLPFVAHGLLTFEYTEVNPL